MNDPTLSYQITFLDYLHGEWPLLISMATIYILAFCVISGKPATDKNMNTKYKLSFYLILFLLLECFWHISLIGSGWDLSGDLLSIHIGGVQSISETIDVRSVQIFLVDSSSSWYPEKTNYGLISPYLSLKRELNVGWCTLENGKHAIVFYHLDPSQMLVLWDGKQYCVIAYPGVENLFNALIARGAIVQSFN